MSRKNYFSTIEEFLVDTPASKMIKDALKEILPQRGNLFSIIISATFGIIFGLIIGLSLNTVQILTSVVGTLFEVVLAVFGCIFAVYSILLAFLNDEYIKKLAKIDSKNGISFLKESTTYYESVLFLYFIAIAISGILLLFLNCVDDNFVLTSNNTLNNSLAIVSIFIYLTFVFRIIYELKSTIYNTIRLFRASLSYKILSFIENEKEDKDNDNNK